MVGLACFGVYRIKMDYKSVQYVDATSYQAKYYKIIQDLFPKYQYGKLTTIEVYIGKYVHEIILKNLSIFSTLWFLPQPVYYIKVQNYIFYR